jgi:nitrogen fixation NifU-like protein
VFSDVILDHALNRRNLGALQHATHKGCSGDPEDGPWVRLWFVVEDGMIVQASYAAAGCPAAIASASIAAQVPRGRTVLQALSLTHGATTLLFGGLPEGREHVPMAVVDAIHAASRVCDA